MKDEINIPRETAEIARSFGVPAEEVAQYEIAATNGDFSGVSTSMMRLHEEVTRYVAGPEASCSPRIKRLKERYERGLVDHDELNRELSEYIREVTDELRSCLAKIGLADASPAQH
jgi:hypothetical protein